MAAVQLDDVRKLLVDNCVLRISPEEIKTETRLFGPDSLGLDSIDALQLALGVEKSYGIAVTDPTLAREAFHSVETLQTWLNRQMELKAA